MPELDENGQDELTSPKDGEQKIRFTLMGIPLHGIELFWMVIYGAGMILISEVTDLPGSKMIYMAIGVTMYALFRR
ncbi:hypothetical protein MUP29_09810 [bacterium]|nr:hypothetical protein [bacterium]